MIPIFDLHRVRLMEFFQVMQNIKTFLEKQDLSDLGLEKVKTTFDNKLLALQNAIKPVSKSIHTTKINTIDANRDKLLTGFLAYCRAFLKFPEEEKVHASQLLLAAVEKYGKNLQEKPMKEETAIIFNLLKDFEELKYQQAIATIGAEKWIENLGKSNEEFSKLFNMRTEEQSNWVAGSAKEARKEMYDEFKHLVKSINALAYINGEDKYKSLANFMNEEIQQARN